MYSYLKGQLISNSEDTAIIEVHGIGYRLGLPPNYGVRLPPIGSNVYMHVSYVIREFSQAFYGFIDEQERDLFEKLLNISGIGPKLALSIIGHLRPQELKAALISKDVSLLCKVPGIGKKTAERLLLELKETALSLIQIDSQVSLKQPPVLHDAISALVNLGINPLTAHRAVTKTIENYKEAPDLASLIAESLQLL
jgi:holliday junction DNA helicase RuvA